MSYLPYRYDKLQRVTHGLHMVASLYRKTDPHLGRDLCARLAPPRRSMKISCAHPVIETRGLRIERGASWNPHFCIAAIQSG